MKKGYKLILILVLLGIIFGIGNYIFTKAFENKLQKHVFEEYKFEISYPSSYKSVKESGDGKNTALYNVNIKESGEDISEYMSNLKFVELLDELKNSNKQIRFIIEAIAKDKTDLSMEEICSRHIVMFKIYNEEAKILNTKKEIVTLQNTEVGKVTIEIEGKATNTKLIAYLISLEDREITLTFIAPNKSVIKYEKEINKIINTLKFL